jgi:class 3 adenylate cyclase
MSRAARRAIPLALKVNIIIVASLVIGIGGAISYISLANYRSSLAETDLGLRQQSQILYYAIKNLMLPGEAPIARSFLADIQQNAGLDYTIGISRVNGVEAFVDNQTIRTVNANIRKSGMQFPLKPEPTPQPRRKDMRESHFHDSAEMGNEVIFQVSGGPRVVRTIFTPLLNSPPCTGCHGTDHTIRGIIEVTTDLTEEFAGPRNALLIAGAFFLVLVTALALVLTQFLRRTVIAPVTRIGAVCAEVTAGRFDSRVETSSRDELGQLGRTVNTMVEGLFERFELSKFVSSSTVQSIRDGAKGKREAITMLFSDVRGFTSYSERQEPETIVASLNKLLTAQTEIIHAHGGDVDKYVGDEIVSIFTGPDQQLRACRAALAIQHELVRNRTVLYDGLSVGVGINSGEVVLGMIGSEKRADFTVIGDAVNYTARLCSSARPGMIIISEAAWDAVRGKASAKGPYALRVKGKEAEQKVYLLQGLKEEPR